MEDWEVQLYGQQSYPVGTAAQSFPDPSFGNGSGFFQAFAALGTGYLARRLDIDLQGRAIGNQPMPSVSGTGPRTSLSGQIPSTLLPAAGATWAQFLLPLVAVGAVAYLIARR